MFEVKGVPILVDELEVLKELRNQVLQITGREILNKMRHVGDNIMICCPIHNNGQERKPSCGITTVPKNGRPPGIVNCFACSYTDTLEGMISKCFGYDGTAYGENWLLENFLNGEAYGRPDIAFDLSRGRTINTTKYVSEEELATYRFYHPYMYKRKLTNEVIDKYDIGYQKDFQFESVDSDGNIVTWRPTEVITFPVRDEYGRCLFVSRRAIHDKTFFLPRDIDKPVYGIYELPKDCKEVIICESVINALTCVAYGRPALALFGTGSKPQYEQLNKLPVRKYILGLDPDSAGAKGTEKLKWNLKGKVVTKLVVPSGKDINDLSKEEFLNLPEIFI